MAVDVYKLEVHKRESMSKSALKRERKSGSVPGIYYSHDSKTSIPFFIDRSELHSIQKSGARLLKISVGGKLVTVFFKAVQYHPVTDEVLHFDLYGVKMDEKIQIAIPLRTVGEPIGVLEEGGQLSQPMQEVDVLCLPTDIPEILEVDISELHMSESINAGKIELPEGVELISSPETVVAIVSHGLSAEDTETVEEEDEDLLFDDDDATDEEDSEGEGKE